MYSPSLILLAWGVSSRMKAPLPENAPFIEEKLIEEAASLPKCMLSVGVNGRRFIDYLIKNAYEAGYRDIILIIHPNNTDIEPYVTSLLTKDMYLDLEIRFAKQYIPEGREKPFGTWDALYQALSQCSPKSGWYTLSNSDNLLGVPALKKAFACEKNTLLSYDPSALNISRERLSSYGLVVSNKDQVESLIEKPPLSDIEVLESQGKLLSLNMNLGTFSVKSTLESLKNLVPHPVRNEKEVTDTYSFLITKNDLASMIIAEWVPDLTSKLDIPSVQEYLKKAYPNF